MVDSFLNPNGSIRVHAYDGNTFCFGFDSVSCANTFNTTPKIKVAKDIILYFIFGVSALTQ